MTADTEILMPDLTSAKIFTIQILFTYQMFLYRFISEMKNRLSAILFCVSAVSVLFSSCRPDVPVSGSDSANFITLSTESSPVIYQFSAEPLVVDVSIDKVLEEDLEIVFALSDKDGIVNLVDNPVVIKAGQTHSQMKIVSSMKEALPEARTYLLGLSLDYVLPSGMLIKDNFPFTVTPSATDVMTDAQKNLLDAYKQSTGVDLSLFLGLIDVNTVIVGSDPVTGEPLDPEQISGKSVLALSAKSSEQSPVISMLDNPMGIRNKVYSYLRAATVENPVWTEMPEQGGGEGSGSGNSPENGNEEKKSDYMTLMNTIRWNKNSVEDFVMTLDGIKFGSDKDVEFVGKGTDQSGKEIAIVPFDYSFSAYDRELAAISDGTLVKGEEWLADATARPSYHINNETIASDALSGNNWVQAKASVSNEKLEFVFCFSPGKLYKDYVRVTATYSPARTDAQTDLLILRQSAKQSDGF